MGNSKSGGGARKLGRGMRKPSHNRYTMEQRWIKNKERRVAKQAKLEAKQKARKIKREQG
jgi:hypothetical protein